MTATVHLTDTQLAQFIACGLIVVDGEGQAECAERCPGSSRLCERETGHSGRHESVLHGAIGNSTRAHVLHWTDGYPVVASPGIPDHALVAPECLTCLGKQGSYRLNGCPNPDCDRGRQVVTLTATCTHPDHDVIGRMGHLLCTRCKTESIPETGYRWRSHPGVVTLGRFTIRLLPIYDTTDVPDDEDPMAAYDDAGDWVEADRDAHAVLWWHSDRKIDGAYCTYLALDPLPQPGQWVVQLAPVAALTGNSAPARPVDPGAEAL